MSSGQDPQTVFDRAQGEGITGLAVNAIEAWILATALSVVAGIQALFDLLFLPFELFFDIASSSVETFILEPFGIVGPAAEITAEEVVLFDFLALPAAVAIALGTLFVVLLFLQLDITSNIFPGLFIDNRIVDFFFTSPEEEAEGEE